MGSCSFVGYFIVNIGQRSNDNFTCLRLSFYSTEVITKEM